MADVLVPQHRLTSPVIPAGGPRRHLPALDGLRGVAIVAVLLFHHGVTWARGGFLGVSLFFTLSGFLIATLLIREFDATGTVRFVDFFGRRARRLLPAALVTIAGVWAAGVGGVWTTAGLRGDLVSSVLYVANWRFLFDGSSYQRIFEEPSPLLHFWSLAIEEQFYLLVAPALVFALRRGQAGLFTSVAATVSLGVGVWAGVAGETDFVYYSSVARGFELFVGVGLALVVARTAPDDRWVRRAAHLGGLPALGAVIAAIVFVGQTSQVLYVGGLAVFALASAMVVLSAATDGSVIERPLRFGPLVRLGQISYGLYLAHWPIFLWLTPERTGLRGSALFVLRVAASVAVAALSHALIERRMRFAWPWRERTAILTGAAATVVVAVLVASVPPAPAERASDFAAAQAELRADRGDSVATRALEVGVYGDSTALMTALGLKAWAQQTDDFAVTSGVLELGCGLVTGGTYIYGSDPPRPVSERCDWPDTWAAQLDRRTPDVAVVQVGPWDVADHRLPGDDKWRRPGDPVYDAYLEKQIAAVVALFTSRSVQVVWLTSPKVELGRLEEPPRTEPYATSDPARMERLNELITTTLAGVPDVIVVDLAGYLASLPGGEMDARLRPDGVHFTEETAEEVAAWLGPAILAAAEQE